MYLRNTCLCINMPYSIEVTKEIKFPDFPFDKNGPTQTAGPVRVINLEANLANKAILIHH